MVGRMAGPCQAGGRIGDGFGQQDQSWPFLANLPHLDPECTAPLNCPSQGPAAAEQQRSAAWLAAAEQGAELVMALVGKIKVSACLHNGYSSKVPPHTQSWRFL